jgi:hypothetical protein
LGELGGELRRVGSPIGGVAEDLRETDGRDDRTAGDRLGYDVGAGLIAKIGEQRRSVENESQLLGVFAGGFCAPSGEQSIDHRPSWEIAEQAATLLGHGAIRAQSQRAVLLGAQEHASTGLQIQLAAHSRWQDHPPAFPDRDVPLRVGHTASVPQF